MNLPHLSDERQKFKFSEVRGVAMQTLLLIVALSCVTPALANNQKWQNSVSQQSTQRLLKSIEERLRNLDSVCQYAQGEIDKVELNGRKLESLESRISRFEAMVEGHFVKITENISNGHFRQSIANDHILRKIDSIYDRINHRLLHLEMKVDLGEKKIMDKLELMLNRFEKMEDTVTTREADIEEEIGDVLSIVDEIKSNQPNFDLDNITKVLNATKREIQKEINTIDRRIEHNLAEFVNKSLQEYNMKEENLKSIIKAENYKLSENQEIILKKSDMIQHNLKNAAAIINMTRNEQQNGIRTLVVQVGRLGGKNNVLSDSIQEGPIKNLGDKIDENFENIMVLQNLFLESCHRIQMDETQVETKISEVLEKLIEMIERRSLMEAKDLKNIEQQIKNHDSTITRAILTASHMVIHKGKENKEDLAKKLNHIESRIQFLCMEVEELKNGEEDESSKLLMEKLMGVELELQAILNTTQQTNSMFSNATEFALKLQRSLEEISRNNTSHNQRIINLQETINDLHTKIVRLGNYINYKIDDVIDNNPHKIAINSIPQVGVIASNEYKIKHDLEKLNTIIPLNSKKYNNTNDIDPNLDEIIREVFGLRPVYPIDEENEIDNECRDIDIDVRDNSELPKKCGRKPDKNLDEIVFTDVELSNCTDINIDVRNGVVVSKKCMNGRRNDTEFRLNSESSEAVTFLDGQEGCNEFGIDVRSGAKCSNRSSGINQTAIAYSYSEKGDEAEVTFLEQQQEDCNDLGIGIKCASNLNRNPKSDDCNGLKCKQEEEDVSKTQHLEKSMILDVLRKSDPSNNPNLKIAVTAININSIKLNSDSDDSEADNLGSDTQNKQVLASNSNNLNNLNPIVNGENASNLDSEITSKSSGDLASGTKFIAEILNPNLHSKQVTAREPSIKTPVKTSENDNLVFGETEEDDTIFFNHPNMHLLARSNFNATSLMQNITEDVNKMLRDDLEKVDKSENT